MSGQKKRESMREDLIGSTILLIAGIVMTVVWHDDNTLSSKGTPRSFAGPLMLGGAVLAFLLTGVKALWQRRKR